MADPQDPLPAKERRRHSRSRFNTPVLFSPVTESRSGQVLEVTAAFLTAKIRNLCENGICLELLEIVPKTDILLVHLKVPHRPDPLMIYAKKIWEKGRVGGFEFIVIQEADRSAIQRHIEKEISSAD